MANPLSLLKNSIAPTRGINSTVYWLFNSHLGVFDLSGQENKKWLSKEKIIPVVILTSSSSDEDILSTYELHANCFITKPVDIEQFTKVVQYIGDF